MEKTKKDLLKILSITEPGDGKEDLAAMMAGLIYEESIYDLMQTLSEARRKSAAKKWESNTNNPAALTSLIKHYFTEKQIAAAMEKAAAKAVNGYLQTVDKSLNQEQRDELQKLSEKFVV